jgi:very-short-patch-repair endonuclease
MSSPEVREKYKQICLEKYGVENAGSLDWVKKKISETQTERMLDPQEREKISIATKIAMQRDGVKKNHLTAVRKPKSKETLERMAASSKQKFINDPTLKDRIYTEKRNENISKSKKIYWATHPEERKRIMDIWKKRSETKLEIKMYDFLLKSGIRFEKRYELDHRQYDAYLPDHNILLEFDGEFWHRKSLDECKYSFQTFNFYNDIRKNEIAKKHGIPLFRIRENEPPEKILDCIKL